MGDSVNVDSRDVGRLSPPRNGLAPSQQERRPPPPSGFKPSRLSENMSLTDSQRSSNSWTYGASGDTTTDSEKDENDELEEGEMLVPASTRFSNSSGRQKSKKTSETKMTIYVYMLSLFAAIGGFLFGYDTGVVSGAMLLVDRYYNLSAIQHELVVSVTIAAAAVGAAFGGSINEWIGRRKALILASVVFTAGAGCMAGSPRAYWEVLFTGRMIVGLGIGKLDSGLCYVEYVQCLS